MFLPGKKVPGSNFCSSRTAFRLKKDERGYEILLKCVLNIGQTPSYQSTLYFVNMDNKIKIYDNLFLIGYKP